MKNHICCFGELLFRFMPSKDFVHEPRMGFSVGGAELNVARALARWDVPTAYMTALPDHHIAQTLTASLEAEGVDMSSVHWGSGRIGSYYLSAGSELKHLGVVYDRDHSTFSQLRKGILDWNALLEGAQWLHLTAISPALSQAVAEVVLEAAQAAKAMGIKVSIDLNYRSKLWQYGVAPPLVMTPIVALCDVVMGNIWAMESLLDLRASIPNSQGKTHQELLEAATQSIATFSKTYKASHVALTFRLENSYWAVLDDRTRLACSNVYPIEHPVDKVGTGDCFMAGLLYGLYHQLSTKEILDFAAMAAVRKHYEVGDATQHTTNDIYHFLNS